MLKTYQPKAKEIKRDWHLVDAKGQVLGRLATQIATYLIGKHKVDYSTHMDSGDFVVVTNVEKIEVTGRKAQQKLYRRHSGYPGGYKERTYQQVMAEHPERILKNAVAGMIPDNRLKDERMIRLKLVVGEENPYQDKFEALNTKSQTSSNT